MNKQHIGPLIIVILIKILHSESAPISKDKNVAKSKSNILILMDNTYFSHLQLAVYLSSNLQKHGHQVLLYVEDHHGITDRDGIRISIDPGVEVIIRHHDPEFKAQFGTVCPKPQSIWDTVSYSTEQQGYWDMIAYRTAAQYYELTQRKCNQNLLETLKNANFDLGIYETHDLGALAVFHELGIKNTVATSATPILPIFMHLLDLPLPLTVPELYSARFGDCADKNCIQNPLRQKKNEWRYRTCVAKFEQICERIHREFYIQKFGANGMPKLTQLFKNSKLFLANTIEEASIPRPMLNKIRHIGGVATKTDLYKNKWTNPTDSDKCIILMCFGSLISFDTMPEHSFREIIDAFGQFGQETECQFVVKMSLIQISKYYRIDYAKNVQKIGEFMDMDLIYLDPLEELNKSNDDSDSNKPLFPTNVYPVRWMKQQELLASPNVRALITHCGQNSMNEAVLAGVPLLCMPLVVDEHFNAATMEYHKLGVWLQASAGLSKAQLLSALRRLFEPSNNYHQNSRNFALKLQNKMEEFGTPADQFIELIDQIFDEQFDFEDGKVIGMDRVPGASIVGSKFPIVDFAQKWSDQILDAQNSDEAIAIMG